jgi:hypothetical protein
LLGDGGETDQVGEQNCDILETISEGPLPGLESLSDGGWRHIEEQPLGLLLFPGQAPHEVPEEKVDDCRYSTDVEHKEDDVDRRRDRGRGQERLGHSQGDRQHQVAREPRQRMGRENECSQRGDPGTRALPRLRRESPQAPLKKCWSTSMRLNWVLLNKSKRPVRANTTRLTIEMTWYPKGMAADRYRPSSEKVATQTTARAETMVAVNVNDALRSRSSSTSSASTPIVTSRFTQEGTRSSHERRAFEVRPISACSAAVTAIPPFTTRQLTTSSSHQETASSLASPIMFK